MTKPHLDCHTAASKEWWWWISFGPYLAGLCPLKGPILMFSL